MDGALAVVGPTRRVTARLCAGVILGSGDLRRGWSARIGRMCA